MHTNYVVSFMLLLKSAQKGVRTLAIHLQTGRCLPTDLEALLYNRVLRIIRNAVKIM